MHCDSSFQEREAFVLRKQRTNDEALAHNEGGLAQLAQRSLFMALWSLAVVRTLLDRWSCDDLEELDTAIGCRRGDRLSRLGAALSIEPPATSIRTVLRVAQTSGPSASALCATSQSASGSEPPHPINNTNNNKFRTTTTNSPSSHPLDAVHVQPPVAVFIEMDSSPPRGGPVFGGPPPGWARQQHAHARARASSSPRSPPLVATTPTSAALCLSGLAAHGMVGSHAITEPAQYERLARWVGDIRERGRVRLDVFAHLDLRREARPKTLATQGRAVEFGGGRAHARGDDDAATGPLPLRVLDGAVQRLRPVNVSLHRDPPFCGGARAAYCNCTRAWPRWLEQMLKRERCMELVRAHERRVGAAYDWVMQMRSDYNTEAPDHASRAVDLVAALTEASPDERLVRTKPHFPPPGYGQMDFFWLSRRAAADTMTSLLHASCAWLRCATAHAPQHMQNERLLVEWALRGKLRVTKMAPAGRGGGGAAAPSSRAELEQHGLRRCDAL